MSEQGTLPAPVTLVEARRYAEEIIAEVGEHYTYPIDDRPSGECQYVHEWQPDCFVARILHRHGVPVEVLHRWESYSAQDMGPNGPRFNRDKPAPSAPLIAADAVAFLNHLQNAQDDEIPWGRSLEYAHRCAALTA